MTMRRRIRNLVILVAMIKIILWFFVFGSITWIAVQILAVFDTFAIVFGAPWVGMGRPLPAKNKLVGRAARSAGALTLILGGINIVLQIPLYWQRSADMSEFVVALATRAISDSWLYNPIGGVGVFVVATLLAVLWLSIRVPKAARTRKKAADNELRGPSGRSLASLPTTSPPGARGRPGAPRAG